MSILKHQHLLFPRKGTSKAKQLQKDGSWVTGGSQNTLPAVSTSSFWKLELDTDLLQITQTNLLFFPPQQIPEHYQQVPQHPTKQDARPLLILIHCLKHWSPVRWLSTPWGTHRAKGTAWGNTRKVSPGSALGVFLRSDNIEHHFSHKSVLEITGHKPNSAVPYLQNTALLSLCKNAVKIG